MNINRTPHYDHWFAAIRIDEKTRIAGKLAGRTVNYPECTDIWNVQGVEMKMKVYEHCVNRHGDKLTEWFDGKPFTD